MTSTRRPVIAGTRIGHVHLKVADFERALGFYRDVLGFADGELAMFTPKLDIDDPMRQRIV